MCLASSSFKSMCLTHPIWSILSKSNIVSFSSFFLNCLNYQYIVLKIYLCHNTNTWIDEHIIYNTAYEFDIFEFFSHVLLFSVVATFDSLCLSSVVWPNFPAFIVTILFLCTNLHLLLHPRKTGYLPLNPRDPGKMLTVPSVNACTECVKKIQC